MSWVPQVYAFSAENWQRSAVEVGFLLQLIDSVLQAEVGALADRGITLRFLGDLESLPAGLQERVRWCATLLA
jgi:undecaprenyl diphosphate synthase